MKTKWKIEPIKCSGPIGYKWRWIKAAGGKVIEKSEKPFDYYYDCLADAQKKGYHVVDIKSGQITVSRGREQSTCL